MEVPYLEFLHHTADIDEEHRFMDFVDRVLILRNISDIEKFHLKCDYGNYNPYRLNSWICYAIKHNVQPLYLDVSMKQPIELPRNLFTSFKLRVLKLGGYVSFHFPIPVLLPRLKILHLDRLDFVDDDFMKTLISGCPLLKELEILGIKGDKIKTLYICSSNLKKLKIRVPYYAIKNRLQGIVVRAPLLESLHIFDFSPDNLDVGELPSLVEADIDLSVSAFFRGVNSYPNIVVQLLSKICHVKCLKLSCFKLMVPANYVLAFHNLVHFEVSFFEWQDIHYLLEKTPKLKFLALKISFDDLFFPHLRWGHLLENVPKCFSSSLEAIECCQFSGIDGEMKLIEYF